MFEYELITKDLFKSFEHLKVCEKDLRSEFSNSFRYKYISLIGVYVEFVKMILRVDDLYEIGKNINYELEKVYRNGSLNQMEFEFLNKAIIIESQIKHRCLEASDECIIEFLNNNKGSMMELKRLMNSYLK